MKSLKDKVTEINEAVKERIGNKSVNLLGVVKTVTKDGKMLNFETENDTEPVMLSDETDTFGFHKMLSSSAEKQKGYGAGHRYKESVKMVFVLYSCLKNVDPLVKHALAGLQNVEYNGAEYEIDSINRRYIGMEEFDFNRPLAAYNYEIKQIIDKDYCGCTC